MRTNAPGVTGGGGTGAEEHGAADPIAVDPITAAINQWRDKLLDIGNRNPLVNCSFSPSRGVIELVAPAPAEVWRRFAADSAAGESPMRFPWKRDLAGPDPAEHAADEPVGDGRGDGLSGDVLFDRRPTRSLFKGAPGDRPERPAASGRQASDDRAPEPSVEDCLAALGPADLLTTLSDKKLDGRLRTLEGHAKLSLSEQGVHSVYAAFGFLRRPNVSALDGPAEPHAHVPPARSRSTRTLTFHPHAHVPPAWPGTSSRRT